MSKQRQRDLEEWFRLGLLTVFAIAILGWLVWAIYATFWIPDTPKTIKFEVTGIVNGTNANTLVQVHYECIKYCTEQYGSSGYTKDCYNQCTLLGKEGCGR
jgi:hypothetical protein